MTSIGVRRATSVLLETGRVGADRGHLQLAVRTMQDIRSRCSFIRVDDVGKLCSILTSPRPIKLGRAE